MEFAYKKCVLQPPRERARREGGSLLDFDLILDGFEVLLPSRRRSLPGGLTPWDRTPWGRGVFKQRVRLAAME